MEGTLLFEQSIHNLQTLSQLVDSTKSTVLLRAAMYENSDGTYSAYKAQ
jgi:hypothetical protein